jgi:putative transposase
MIKLLFTILKLLLIFFLKSKENLFTRTAILEKENEILRRTLNNLNRRITFVNRDRAFYSFFHLLSAKTRDIISLIKPDTLLHWFKSIIRNRWNFSSKSKRKRGRPPTSAYIKNLILDMKNNNIRIRAGKIQGELLKLGIDLSRSTIRRILADFRKKGKITSALSWKKFITSNLNSLHAMDFFTVDTFFSKRYYVFFIIYLKTREIIKFRMTNRPSSSFVRNQLIGFMDGRVGKKTLLIHDNTGEFLCQDYKGLGITDVRISPYSPNMNAHAERFIGSVRQECLDWFILLSYNQIKRVLSEYIDYYNTMCPHQGIMQNIPEGYTPPKGQGRIVRKPVLSGL